MAQAEIVFGELSGGSDVQYFHKEIDLAANTETSVDLGFEPDYVMFDMYNGTNAYENDRAVELWTKFQPLKAANINGSGNNYASTVIANVTSSNYAPLKSVVGSVITFKAANVNWTHFNIRAFKFS